jgi:hypothetical protein
VSFLKKGPEIKLSELKLSKLQNVKVPVFLQDVYYDLKDRHLLPVAVILLVAIFAVPIAISSNSGESEEGAAAGGASISQSEARAATGALVAEAAPGLRAYERRLDHESASDPFEGEGGGGGQSGGGTITSESSESDPGGSSSTELTPSPEPSEITFPSPEPESAPGNGGSPSKSKLTYFSTAIDVRVTSGSGEEKTTKVRKNLPELTMLPSRETPAIVFMGATKDSKKAVMTISSDVQAIFGDSKCVLGSETCQLLAMEEGLPETFIYGGAEKTYKIEILKIHLVESDKVNKAPLGDEGDKGKKSGDKSGRRNNVGVSDGDQG